MMSGLPLWSLGKPRLTLIAPSSWKPAVGCPALTTSRAVTSPALSAFHLGAAQSRAAQRHPCAVLTEHLLCACTAVADPPHEAEGGSPLGVQDPSYLCIGTLRGSSGPTAHGAGGPQGPH